MSIEITSITDGVYGIFDTDTGTNLGVTERINTKRWDAKTEDGSAAGSFRTRSQAVEALQARATTPEPVEKQPPAAEEPEPEQDKEVDAADEPEAATEDQPDPEPEQAEPETPERACAPPPLKDTADDGKKLLKDLTVDELRACYEEEVGRPTGSQHRRYLMWKIGEARKGNVTVGPIERGQGGDPKSQMVLPLRMQRETVEQLDAAWRRNGYRSRMEFIRVAIRTQLAHHDEHDVVALISDAA